VLFVSFVVKNGRRALAGGSAGSLIRNAFEEKPAEDVFPGELDHQMNLVAIKAAG
jgi:hypothetical protein